MSNIQELIKQGAEIIDVRSPEEFMGGNVMGSKNIPLQEVPKRVDEFKSIDKPIVLCCASGNRSGMATAMLQQQGLTDVYNGGGWLDVNYLKNL